MRRLWIGVCACALVGGGGQIAFTDEPGELLRAIEADNRVFLQKLEVELAAQLSAAHELIAENPTAAIDQLKLLADTLKLSTDLPAELRTVWGERITAALRMASRRVVEHEVHGQQRAASEAAAHERQQALKIIARREAKVEQLVDRFNALLDEGKYEWAQQTAAAVGNAAANSAVGASLKNNANLNRFVNEAQLTRVQRQKGVVDALQRAEIAHVPESDEPPIVYIDAADWQELTLRRGKYPTDMARVPPAEAKIREALDETTEVEFLETPLGDVMEFLKDRHGIEIQLDRKNLELAGIGSDTPVTINLRGVRLRSALKLLLGQLDLTYVISNEVLLVTTPELSETMIESHVHYVGDLVLSIPQTGFKGGFGSVGGNTGMFGVGGSDQSGGSQNGMNNLFQPGGNNNGNQPGQNQNGNNFF